MSSFSLTTLLGALILFCGPDTALADRPTLKETASWLTDHLPAGSFTYTEALQNSQSNRYFFSGCKFTIVSNEYAQTLPFGVGGKWKPLPYTVVRIHAATGYRYLAKAEPQGKTERPASFREGDFAARLTYVIDLAHIDPGHIEVENIVGSHEAVEEIGDGEAVEFSLVASKRPLGPRIAAAFRYAIRACGGKSDAF